MALLHPKLIYEKANLFSASLRHLQDTAGQSHIVWGTNDMPLVLKHKAGLNRNNLYLSASSFSYSFL